MSIESYYIPCSRKRYIITQNDTGRDIKTYTTTSINGYLGSRTQNVMKVAGKDSVVSEYKFYCDDLELQFDDIIVYKGISYRVASEPQNTINKNHHIKCELRKIEDVTA
jgi:hypothetical protein